MDDQPKQPGSEPEQHEPEQPKPATRRLPPTEIPALPPWHPGRDTLLLNEVPAYLKRLYGITMSYALVRKWAKEGMQSTKTGKRVYLKTTKMGRYAMVTKSDLLAYLGAE